MSTTIRNQKLFCDCCGQEYALKFPIGIKEMNRKMKAFTTLHDDCPKTWQEPVVDQSKSIEEKANFWIQNGEKGLSSQTIWNCFMGILRLPVNHPHDPDDFKRCYKLLETVPEWKCKSYMNKLKDLSPQWKNLVDNWDKLTEMYEQNVSENWKNYQEIGMYKFMQNLIK
jgi:hypothetical protein